MYKIPSLLFKYSDLEPFIDEATMMVHYLKHHQTYADKLNAALEKHPEFKDQDLRELIYDADKLPEDIRTAVVNNGGGFLNHSFFWNVLSKPQTDNNLPEGMKIGELIDAQFGDFETFKKRFTDSALALFGSGWTWLLVSDGKLEIVNTANQLLPSRDNTAVLTLDLWEHAYYLQYQNRRAEYVEAFWHVINWPAVDGLFTQSGASTAKKTA